MAGLFDGLDFSMFDPNAGAADPLTGFRPGSLLDAAPRAAMGLQPPQYPPPLDPALKPPAPTPNSIVQQGFGTMQGLPLQPPQPGLTITPPPAPPPIKPPVSPTAGVPGSTNDQDLGQAIGDPLNIQSEAQMAGTAATSPAAAATEKTLGEKLASTLKGVKAPPAPSQLKIGAPGVPRASASIKTGQLAALLQSLAPKGAGGGADGLNLPSTLNAALKR